MKIGKYGMFTETETKINSVWGWETNEFYDPARVNNGGGYAQPAGGALFALPDGREVLTEVEDSSCGDFGSRVRYSATLYQEGAPTHAWVWCEGTLGTLLAATTADVTTAQNAP